MALFRRDAPEPPQITENHQHEAPSIADAIITGFGVVVVAVLLGWRGIVHLVAAAGIQQPEAAAARSLGWLFAISVTISVAVLLFWLAVNPLLDKWIAHRERMAQLQINLAREMTRMKTSASIDRRELPTSPDDVRLHRLIESVMVDAYAHGDYAGNDPRPWARAALQSRKLANETKSVGYSMANRARVWLREQEIIIGANGRETLNFRRYPDVAAVQRKLYGVSVVRE